MKCDKNFRIDKQTKRFMATILDPVERSRFKNTMIAAQLFGSQTYKSEKKNKKETSE